VMERIRIETGTKTTQAKGGTAWTTTATERRWAEAVWIPTERAERYQSVDGKVDYEFRFKDWPTVTMAGSRFVWVTNGHPNCGKVYYPVKPPTRIQGSRREMVVLVRDSGETASETFQVVASAAITTRASVSATGEA